MPTTHPALSWLLTLALAGGAFAVDNPPVEYLSREAYPRIAFQLQGWGVLGIDTSVHADGQQPLKLRIKDKEYERGLGTHAPGEMLVELDGLYDAFDAEAGMQWQGGTKDCGGSIVMQVYVDGKVVFDSGVMRQEDAAVPVSIPLKGAEEMRLVLGDAGDGFCCDCADWAEARLTRNPNAQVHAIPDTFEIGRFGRLVTSDPHRMDGARATRVQEFRADDVFLETNLRAAADGSYTVPRALDGLAAVGLVWTELRTPTRLELAPAPGAQLPAADGVQVQCWDGESLWQGEWKPVHGTIEVAEGRWVLNLDPVTNPTLRAGWRKIRWVLPAATQPLRVARLAAFTRSRWQEADVRLDLEHPRAGEKGEVVAYNGEIVAGGAAALRADWDLSQPLSLHVRLSRPRAWKWDRTTLRLRLPGPEGQPVAFAIALEDLLEHGQMYVPSAGLFATVEPAKLSLAEAKQESASYRSIRERVEEMPDQTLAQAWEHVHNPVQNNGPTMVSLACDNRKFVVSREGTVQFSTVPDVPDPLLYYPQQYPCELRAGFGSGDLTNVERHVEDGWLPIPTTTVKQGDLVYSQRTFVVAAEEPTAESNGWLSRKPLCVVEYTLTNGGDQPADAALTLTTLADVAKGEKAQAMAIARGAALHNGSQIIAVVDASAAGPLAFTLEADGLALRGQLPAKGSARCVALIPGWFVEPQGHAGVQYAPELLDRAKAYWQHALAGAAQIDTPDDFLNDTIRASQVACLIAARNEAGGARVSPWIAANVYGPLESEANSIVRGMDLLGQHEFSRRALGFFIKRYDPAGFLTTGYTLVGTGWHLHSVGEHYRLTRDRDWLTGVAPEVGSVCRWIVRQRGMTKRVDENLAKVPEYGLVPPGVTADWGLFTYRVYNQALYAGGLRAAADALADVGSAEAGELQAEAADFQREVLRAYGWAQGNLPVLQSPSGAWVPAAPTMLEAPGKVEQYYPGADGSRSWASDVEIGPHHLAWIGVMDPQCAETTRMLDNLEDYWYLRSGMGDYDEARSHADWFNLGGFAKVQPYYGRSAELYAMRDEVKPFIRAYFNAIPALLNRETMTFWEHFHNQGAWNKTHETGSFLSQSRMMFVVEHGDELWLAPCVTSNWLQDGQAISIRNAPTGFGPVSYTITSHVAQGFIEASVTPPTRDAAKAIVIRVRHPEGRRMKSVTVNGQAHTDFDAEREIVRLKGDAGEVKVRAEY